MPATRAMPTALAVVLAAPVTAVLAVEGLVVRVALAALAGPVAVAAMLGTVVLVAWAVLAAWVAVLRQRMAVLMPGMPGLAMLQPAMAAMVAMPATPEVPMVARPRLMVPMPRTRPGNRLTALMRLAQSGVVTLAPPTPIVPVPQMPVPQAGAARLTLWTHLRVAHPGLLILLPAEHRLPARQPLPAVRMPIAELTPVLPVRATLQEAVPVVLALSIRQ